MAARAHTHPIRVPCTGSSEQMPGNVAVASATHDRGWRAVSALPQPQSPAPYASARVASDEPAIVAGGEVL